MANLTESPVWEKGIYQWETTDPLLGGPDGIDNVPTKQLANRTLYLKQRADDVDKAKGTSASLAARMAALAADIEAASPATQDAMTAAIKFTIDQAALANQGVQALHQFAQQEGILRIQNRGVVSGCVVSKSTSAARNLNISSGVCFAKGLAFRVADGDNAASVPSNTGNGAVAVQAYLYPDAQSRWRLAVTAIGQAVPDNGIVLYQLTVPAQSTDATDPNLTNVSLTDLRRIEAQFPLSLDRPATVSPQINSLPDSAYTLVFDVLSAVGAPAEACAVVVSSRATNGFTARLASAADDVVVRWRLSRLNA
ncbi:MAG: hypothetical protein LBL69_06420 [Zoogloeaceae bacterium]|jgi:hypothetical protein|nr:hypothetical protein [Zoogloeaceae bacterium]